MGNDITKQIIQSISAIVDDKMKKSDFTKTIDAEIVKVLDRTKGKYQVKYKDIFMEASTSNTSITYPIGSKVKILIKNEDLSEEKIILNAREGETVLNVPLELSEDRFIPVGDNSFIGDNKAELSSYRQNVYELKLYDVLDGTNLVGLNINNVNQNIKGASKVLMGADFRTTIPAENQMKGNFGLKYIFEFYSQITKDNYELTYTIDVNDMIGNPYKQVEETLQHKVLNIDGVNFLRVKKIIAFVYGFPHNKPDSEINTSDIFINHFQLYKVQTDISGLVNRVGGRNLAINTAYNTDRGTFVRGSNTNISIDETNKYNSNNSLKIVTTEYSQLGFDDIFQYLYNPMIIGNRLLVSFYIKGDKEGTGWMQLVGATSSNQMQRFDVAKDWKRVTLDLGIVQSTGVPNGLKMVYGFDAPSTYYMNSMMVEYGEQYSDWVPAPEDIQQSIKDIGIIVGPQGPMGEQGPPGKDGLSSYTHIAYANSANGLVDFSTSDQTNRSYIGVLVDHKELDSTTPSDYTWSLIKGLDGNNGAPGPKGEDGRTPYFHVAYANNNTGTLDFSTTDGLNKKYMGTMTDWTQADSTNPALYTWSLIQGPQGPAGQDGSKGLDGANGYVHLAYADSPDGLVNFSTTDSGNRTYIGAYTDNNVIDSNVPGRYKWSLIKGAKGDQGTPGAPGADGRNSYAHFAYADSADGTVGFSTTDSLNKKYLGVYTDDVLQDSADPKKYKWTLVKGQDGLKGADGATGLQGPPGKDGKSSYTHIAWANNETGTLDFSTSIATGKKYIGMYVDSTQADSLTPSKYKWTLIKGQDGAQGTPGLPGADGKTPYVHFAYATNSTGTEGFSTTDSTGKTYMGFYTDFIATDSNDPSLYKWTSIQGPQGVAGQKGADGITYYTWIKYADTPTTGMSNFPDGKAYMGIATNKTTNVESENYSDYTWSLIKGAQGVKGDNGQTLYTWIKYADTAAGAGMSDDPSGKRYIGIAVNQVTAVKSTNPKVYTWSPLYDNVKVGGRNYILDSKFIEWNPNNNTMTPVIKDKTDTYYRLKNSGAGTQTHLSLHQLYIMSVADKNLSDDNVLKDTYTASLWVKGPKDSAKKLQLSMSAYADTTFLESAVAQPIEMTGDWQRLSVTLSPTKPGATKLRLALNSASDTENWTGENDWLYIERAQLESGNIATDWKLAPEDVIQKITTVSSDLQVEKNRINAIVQEQTTITGRIEAEEKKSTQLTATVDQFKTTVAQTYTTKTDFEKLSIGGRNYVKNSRVIDWTTASTVYPIIEEYVPELSYRAKRKATNSATNLVANGDFGDGTMTGWTPVNSTNAFIAGGSIENKGTGATDLPYTYKAITTPSVKDHKYYIRFDAKVNTDTKYLSAYIGASANFKDPLTPGVWSKQSLILQSSTDGYANIVLYHGYAGAATAANKVLGIDNVMVINLTATYGKGNEPTKEFMDAIPFFNGTSQIPAISKEVYLVNNLQMTTFDVMKTDSIATTYVKGNVVTGNTSMLWIRVEYTDRTSNSYYGTKDSIAGDWQRLTVSIPPQTKPILYVYAYLYGYGNFTDNWLEVKQLKIENGNKPTDWTPAPEDIEGALSQLNTQYTAFKQTQESFNLTAAKKEEVTTAINNVNIGGRNLLLNSSFTTDFNKWIVNGPFSIVTNGTPSTKISGALNTTYTLRQVITTKIEPNIDYTLSGWVKTVNKVAGTTNALLSLYGDVKDSANTHFYYSVDFGDTEGEWTFISKTFKFNDKVVNPTQHDFYVYARDFTGDAYFYNIKLEKGNKATDWTPAPEDQATNTTVDQMKQDQADTNKGFEEQLKTIVTHQQETDLKVTSDAIVATVTASNKYKNDLNAAANTFQTTTNKIIQDLKGFSDTYSSAVTGLDGRINYIQTYLRYDAPSATLSLGKSDSPFAMSINNQSLNFTSNGSIVAYLNNEKLYITKAEITDEIIIGQHKMMKYNNLTIIMPK